MAAVVEQDDVASANPARDFFFDHACRRGGPVVAGYIPHDGLKAEFARAAQDRGATCTERRTEEVGVLSRKRLAEGVLDGALEVTAGLHMRVAEVVGPLALLAGPEIQKGGIQEDASEVLGHAGAAVSLFGFVQKSIAALCGAVVGALLGRSAWPLAAAVAAMGCATLLLWLATQRVRRAGAKH